MQFVEHSVQSNTRIIRILLKLGDGIFNFGESSWRNRADNMARLSNLVNGAIRQRIEYWIMARDSAGIIPAIQNISGHCAQSIKLSTYDYVSYECIKL